MGLSEFELRVVSRIPESLIPGLLYVCFDCNVVAHLCACGCGKKVILPIDPEFWSVTYDGETVSLRPSIGNYQFPCKSHYWIKCNQIIWVNDSALPAKQKQESWKKKRLFEKIKALFQSSIVR